MKLTHGHYITSSLSLSLISVTRIIKVLYQRLMALSFIHTNSCTFSYNYVSVF